ncbi:DHHW family protein [Paenibacillus sp. GD4]|uniref:DHHW family protein n=1 Tax=Paenibacillus sp. GD4 TaxID=3068890 RepID=UPI0027967ED6|nr:DHHW family protein [Paenibacillus sp. GD4]MDQ1913786.1 DHHW family protein [Paenibacillus sp. GD4]
MRTGSILQICLFLAFLAVGASLSVPFGRSATLSEMENRALTVFPELTAQTLWSGAYFRQLENFIADHVAFRDRLVDVSKLVLSWRGFVGREQTSIISSQANNTSETAVKPELKHTVEPGVTLPPAILPAETEAEPEVKGHVLGKVLITGDRAMNLFTYDSEAGRAYADVMNRSKEVLGVPVTVLLAPTAVEFLTSAKLKKLSSSQREAVEAVYSRLHPSIARVDAITALQPYAREELYFRTDHHWTATGAYYAYSAYMKLRNETPLPLSSYRVEKISGFLGSLHAATKNRQLGDNPDTITVYHPPVQTEYTVHYTGPLTLPLLDMGHATRKNKYRIFLSGDRPWGVIRTDAERTKRLLVVKDSYGNAFIPFLTAHYKEIYVVDPRQFDRKLSEFLREHPVDELLFLNNAEVTMDGGFAEQLKRLVE